MTARQIPPLASTVVVANCHPHQSMTARGAGRFGVRLWFFIRWKTASELTRFWVGFGSGGSVARPRWRERGLNQYLTFECAGLFTFQKSEFWGRIFCSLFPSDSHGFGVPAKITAPPNANPLTIDKSCKRANIWARMTICLCLSLSAKE